LSSWNHGFIRRSVAACTRWPTLSSPSGERSAANGEKLSDTRANPFSRAHAIDSQINHSVNPFGASAVRGIDESESAERSR